MKKALIIIFSFLIFISEKVPAQIGEQNPPGMNWRYIDTNHYKVIFPEELTRTAQRVANIAEYLYDPVSKTLEVKPQRIDLILTNQSVISNGYVALAPRRTEWWSTAPQSSLIGTGDWYNLLASHELRHVAQFEKLNNGFIKVARLFFGETGQMVASYFSVPLWFWEGDAVCTETTLSNTGRGRMPEFDMEIRSLLLSGIKYSYYKAYLGSYRDWYPSHYNLGYLLVTNVRRNFGATAWSDVLDNTSLFSFYPFAFNSSLKKVTGKSIMEVYNDTMEELSIIWKEQLKGLTFTDGYTIQPSNLTKQKVWTSYMFPQYDGDGRLVAVKVGLSDPTTLVLLSREGKEQKLKQISPLDARISVSGGKIIWNEPEFDKRWMARSYTNILSYDLKNGETKYVKTKSRLFAPSISTDCKKIAVIEFTTSTECNLLILDANNGKELKRIKTDEFLRTPAWSQDDKYIVFTRQKMNGIALTILDTSTYEMRDVIPNTFENISNPTFCGNYILYQSPYSGIDNIYAVDIDTGQRFQVTSRMFGAFNPAVSYDGKMLAFSDYTINGYRIVEMPIEPSKWKPIDEIENRNINYYEPLIEQEQGGNIFSEKLIPNNQYEVKKYNPIANAFNLHSWGFTTFPPNLSLSLISTDVLNTTNITGGFEYNYNERTGNVFINASYAGLFPVFDLGLRYGGRVSTYDNGEYYSWRETGLSYGISLPLNLSKGIYTSSLSISTNIELQMISKQTYKEDFKLGNGNFIPIIYQMKYSRAQNSSTRDIYPVWAQNLSFGYQYTPIKSDYNGSRFFTQAELYFPGILKHHSLQIRGSYEIQKPDNYRFESDFSFSRGYKYKFHEKIYKFSVDYAMPLLYPDFNLGQYFYLSRVRTNLFYDHGIGQDNKFVNYQSLGIDVIFDSNFFTFIMPIDFGIRYSYKINEKRHSIQALILNSALYNF